jgi:hypothetical protein
MLMSELVVIREMQEKDILALDTQGGRDRTV